MAWHEASVCSERHAEVPMIAFHSSGCACTFVYAWNLVTCVDMAGSGRSCRAQPRAALGQGQRSSATQHTRPHTGEHAMKCLSQNTTACNHRTHSRSLAHDRHCVWPSKFFPCCRCHMISAVSAHSASCKQHVPAVLSHARGMFARQWWR